MARKTTGKLYTSGAKGFWYIRYQFQGKDYRSRLLDPDGKPITKEKEAQTAANRLLARIHETNKAGMRPASPMVRRKRDFLEWEFTKKMNAVGL